MALQADPTIQYVLGDKPRRLFKSDLKIDSPYNTYMYPGLQPGPINNHGKASLKAAMFPQKSDYLYFVSDGVDSHVFSKSFAEHRKARQALDRLRAKR